MDIKKRNALNRDVRLARERYIASRTYGNALNLQTALKALEQFCKENTDALYLLGTTTFPVDVGAHYIPPSSWKVIDGGRLRE